jgi:Glycosyl hydrolases family 39
MNRKTIATFLLCSVLTTALARGVPGATSAKARATTVTVDYGDTTGTGHPEVFGGDRFQTDSAKAQQLADIGVTFERNIVEITSIVPTTTIADYNANVGNVQDPSSWNWSGFDIAQIRPARNLGIRACLSINFNVPWNSYAGTKQGVPIDWEVYEDIVKKVYQHVLPDQVELWNEPDFSLDLTGSPYGTPQDAYAAIYYHAAHAIRSVDANVPIGGPVTCCSSPADWIPTFLTNPAIPADYINFVSYHNYSTLEVEDRRVFELAQQSRPGIPVHMTEWNADADCSGNPLNANDPATVSFVGMRLSNAINMGIAQADFWALNNDTFCSFFTRGAEEPLLPKARTWLLMSKRLGLGAGPFILKHTARNGVTASIGAINSSGQSVAAVVNNSGSSEKVVVHLNRLPVSGRVTLDIYTASFTSDPSSPSRTRRRNARNNALIERISMPPYSVAGLVIR